MTPSSAFDNAKRVLVGLIGRGIRASRSPRMHEAEADAQGIRLVYSLFDFDAPELGTVELPRILAALELAGFAGINVTHPFKQAIIEHLDDMSAEARQIGAVNTVAFKRGKRIGFNTDTTGFARAFDAGLDDVAVGRVLLLGAGGAGAAVARALLERGVERLMIYDIDEDRAAALAQRLKPHFGARRVPLCRKLATDLARADGIVNATPVGMARFPGMAVPASALHAGVWVADIIYFPLETELLAAARAAGCRVMDGSGMAVWQAAGAFEIFTGWRANAARMRNTFDDFDQKPERRPPRRGRPPKRRT